MESPWGLWPPPHSIFHRVGGPSWTVPGWGTGGSLALPRTSGVMGSGIIGGAGFSLCQSSDGLELMMAQYGMGELLPTQDRRGGWA